MSLVKLNNSYTDKNTGHSYLPLYETLLEPIKDTAKNILEIGIGDFGPKNGGSLLLWKNFFTKATIHGIDILPLNRVLDELINDKSVKLYCESDAYNSSFILNNLNNIKFDFLLDDGPHSLKSQEDFIELYSPLLSENGILMIEDIQDINWLKNLKNKTPEHLKPYIKTYDLRMIKNRHDDIVFTIDLVNKFNNITYESSSNTWINSYYKYMDTREALIYCNQNKIKGSYVECGVETGSHPIIACNTILQNNLDIIDIYMFDTYEGLTKPGKYDYSTNDSLVHMSNNDVINTWEAQRTGKNSNAWCYCSLEDVKNNVYKTNYPKDNLHFIKGDVMETLLEEKNIPDKISVLRLDTDWYESSKFELEKLYHKVVEGGIVILDDYFQWDGQRRATDEFFQENNIKKYIIKNSKKTGYFIK